PPLAVHAAPPCVPTRDVGRSACECAPRQLGDASERARLRQEGRREGVALARGALSPGPPDARPRGGAHPPRRGSAGADRSGHHMVMPLMSPTSLSAMISWVFLLGLYWQPEPFSPLSSGSST